MALGVLARPCAGDLPRLAALTNRARSVARVRGGLHVVRIMDARRARVRDRHGHPDRASGSSPAVRVRAVHLLDRRLAPTQSKRGSRRRSGLGLTAFVRTHVARRVPCSRGQRTRDRLDRVPPRVGAPQRSARSRLSSPRKRADGVAASAAASRRIAQPGPRSGPRPEGRCLTAAGAEPILEPAQASGGRRGLCGREPADCAARAEKRPAPPRYFCSILRMSFGSPRTFHFSPTKSIGSSSGRYSSPLRAYSIVQTRFSITT